MDFSKALKQLFEITALKKSALADEIGYDVSYVSHWISGTKKPSFKNNPELPNQIANFFVVRCDPTHRRALCQMLKIDVESDSSLVSQAILKRIGGRTPSGFIKTPRWSILIVTTSGRRRELRVWSRNNLKWAMWFCIRFRLCRI